jgi:hypothetical protein
MVTNKLLLIIIVLQLFVAGEVAITQEFPTPHEAVCNVLDWVPFIPECE